jgi:hypothetical protein
MLFHGHNPRKSPLTKAATCGILRGSRGGGVIHEMWCCPDHRTWGGAGSKIWQMAREGIRNQRRWPQFSVVSSMVVRVRGLSRRFSFSTSTAQSLDAKAMTYPRYNVGFFDFPSMSMSSSFVASLSFSSRSCFPLYIYYRTYLRFPLAQAKRTRHFSLTLSTSSTDSPCHTLLCTKPQCLVCVTMTRRVGTVLPSALVLLTVESLPMERPIHLLKSLPCSGYR